MVVVVAVVVVETSNRLSDHAARRGSAMSIASLTTSAGLSHDLTEWFDIHSLLHASFETMLVAKEVNPQRYFSLEVN